MASDYVILPFNFEYKNDQDVLLVNQVGQHLFMKTAEFKDFTNKKLTINDELYKILKASHFLTTKEEQETVVEMLAIKLRTRKQFVSDFTSLHMIVVTLRCNCLCRYCHASSVDFTKKNYDMDWNTAKNTIDMIFQSPSDDIKIEYQGGEPFLNWDVVKQSILYAKFLNKFAKKKLSFVICTNLLEITNEQINFCKSHSIEISTSLDGPKEIHDLNRRSRISDSSYDSFVTNATKIKDKLGKYGCAPLLTITRSNIDKLEIVIDEYVKQGYNSIFLRALNPYGNAVKNINELGYTTDEFVEAYKKALDYIIQLNKNGTEFIECYTALFLSRIFSPFSTGFVDLQSPSGAGISGAIYNYDGKVYPADEARMLAKMGDDYFCMGTVFDNYQNVFNGEIMKKIIHNSCVETMPVCSECVYQQYCGADVIRNYLETKDLMGYRLKSGFCEKNKKILDHIFNLLKENNETVNDIFWAWITRRSYKEINLEKN